MVSALAVHMCASAAGTRDAGEGSGSSPVGDVGRLHLKVVAVHWLVHGLGHGFAISQPIHVPGAAMQGGTWIWGRRSSYLPKYKPRLAK